MDIKTIIRRHNETVYTVAEKMGIKQPSLSNIINGNPTVKKLEELARVIGCSPAEFFEDWNADGRAAAEDQPTLSVETEEQTAEPSAPVGTALVGLVRCPQCGHSIRLFAEE